MTAEMLDDAFRQVDYESLQDVHEAAQKVLPTLALPANLGQLWNRMMADDTLVGAAESFYAFQKFVLHDNADTGLRLRLHCFTDQIVEEAHNHRATFSARILRGSYRHFLYGDVDHLWVGDGVPAALPVPRLIQDQLPNTSYTLHHAFIHSTYAMPGTVSLVIQCARVRPSFRIYDLGSGKTRTRVGANQADAAQELGERRLTLAEIVAVSARLVDQGVIV